MEDKLECECVQLFGHHHNHYRDNYSMTPMIKMVRQDIESLPKCFTELNNIKVFVCTFSNLKVIDNLPRNIDNLIIYNNKLSNFNLLLPFLNSIDISNNFLEAIDLSSMNISWLRINNNRLKQLIYGQNLKYLECNNNPELIITHPDSSNLEVLYANKTLNSFTNLPNTLNRLALTDNQLTNDQIINLPKMLEWINLTKNNITSLDPFKHLINLKKLYISSNCITELNYIPCNVSNIYCCSNMITKINLEASSELLNIICYNNPINTIILNNFVNIYTNINENMCIKPLSIVHQLLKLNKLEESLFDNIKNNYDNDLNKSIYINTIVLDNTGEIEHLKITM